MNKNKDIESYYMAQKRIYELQLEKCLKTSFLDLFKALLKTRGTIWLIGNGGSLSVAQHAALDLTKAAGKKAIALTDPAVITAYSNDVSFADGIADYLAAVWSQGDILIALSTSGESPNILSAVQVAKEAELLTVGLTCKGSSLAGMVSLPIEFEEKDPKVLEDVFQITLHKLTKALEDLRRNISPT